MMHSSSCVRPATTCKQRSCVRVCSCACTRACEGERERERVCYHFTSVGVDHVSKRFTGGLQGSSSTERWKKGRRRFKYFRDSNGAELSNPSIWEDPSKGSLSHHSLHRFTCFSAVSVFPHSYLLSFSPLLSHILSFLKKNKLSLPTVAAGLLLFLSNPNRVTTQRNHW